MAIITCPECGKEISDQATSCPNCGYPIKETTQINAKKSNINLKKKLPVIILIGALVVIGIIIYIVVGSPNKIKAKTYDEAIALLEEGKYEEANNLLNTIPDYEDVATLQEQISYESRVFQCIDSLEEYMKNPDSLQIYDVYFYSKEYNDTVEVTDRLKEVMDGLISVTSDEPIIIINYGAENGLGGISTGYAMFLYLTEDYKFIGSSDTLDEEEAYEDDKEICSAMNTVIDYFKPTGNIDLDRIKKILKDDNYTSIKIIE